MSSISRKAIDNLIKFTLVLWLFVGMYLQHNVGLADNGDFTRSMGMFTSGPIGIEPNWPASGTEEWRKRFFNYWIPYWKLDWHITKPTPSSVLLLWLPGVLLNYLLYSSTILYLPAISFFPKIILAVLIFTVFKWLDDIDASFRNIFYVTLGIPLVLMWTTTDYIAYLNSFYQETGSFIFFFLLIASILFLKRFNNSCNNFFLALLVILLLSAAKVANVYWPAIASLFILKLSNHTRHLLIKWVIIVASLTLVCLVITSPNNSIVARFHSLFYGALTFSDRPADHLEKLGMTEATQCIGISAFAPSGHECFERYRDNLSFWNTIRVIYHEPVVAFRMTKHAADMMQNIYLDYGHYSSDDPRSQIPSSIASRSLLNSWSILKYHFFPRGYILIFVLFIFTCWFLWGIRNTGFYQDLSIIGLLATIACFIDMNIAILGEVRQELIKHLFLSNVLFDTAAIAFLNTLIIFCIFRFRWRR